MRGSGRVLEVGRWSATNTQGVSARIPHMQSGYRGSAIAPATYSALIMKKPNQRNMEHSTPAREIHALRAEQMQRCAGGWDIPAGTASPSCRAEPRVAGA